MAMELQHSEQADALYVLFRDETVAYSQDISRTGYYSRGIDFAEDGTLVGVEFLDVSQGVDLTDVPRADEIAALLRKHNIRQLA